MSNWHLQTARNLIAEKDYETAKGVLGVIADNPQAQALLKHIEQHTEQQTTPPVPASDAASAVSPSGDSIELPLRLQTILRKHLAKDEVVLWYEQPDPTIYART